MTICLMMTTRTRMMTRTGDDDDTYGDDDDTYGDDDAPDDEKKKFQAAKTRKTSKTMSWIS